MTCEGCGSESLSVLFVFFKSHDGTMATRGRYDWQRAVLDTLSKGLLESYMILITCSVFSLWGSSPLLSFQENPANVLVACTSGLCLYIPGRVGAT